jgi:hypothetical protein
MEPEILKNMPSNWKAYILNENERPVSTTVRQHLKK